MFRSTWVHPVRSLDFFDNFMSFICETHFLKLVISQEGL